MDLTPWIAALLRERAAYAARGWADRVAAVDEQLAAHGYTPEVAPPETAPAPAPAPAAKSRGERMNRRGV